MCIRDRQHVALRMPSGKVLIAAGWPNTLTSAELYNPVPNTWSLAGNLSTGRSMPSGAVAGNGVAVIAGGKSATYVVLASSDLYSE